MGFFGWLMIASISSFWQIRTSTDKTSVVLTCKRDIL